MKPKLEPEPTNEDQPEVIEAKHPVEQQLKPTHEHAQLAWESLAYPSIGEGAAN